MVGIGVVFYARFLSYCRPMGTPLKIDLRLDESFPHLRHAPITEAVVEVRVRAERRWDETEVSNKLKPKLPDYGAARSERGFEQAITMMPGQPAHQSVSDLGWRGLQFRSADGKNVPGFYRDSFVFSRLQPYPNWAHFSAETLRLWQIHVALAQPSEIQRIGLRFINQVLVDPDGLQLGDFLRSPPQTAEGLELPFKFFFHQDNLSVPGHPYVLNVIRALQPKQETGGGASVPAKLILDIDVSTAMPVSLDRLQQCLEEMRWLKNKAFFGNFTETAINSFR
jgi:uncharacterized protein (TIGR04255 family)